MRRTLPVLLVSVLGTFLPMGSYGAAVSAIPISDNDNDKLGSVEDYPPGDPRRCLEVARRNGYNLQRLEVLPGLGWDNLRNEDQGQVVNHNFSLCRTTDDGRFLLPDTVGAVPVKASNVQTFAELIEHWKNWTSSTSKSINVQAGLSFSHFSISGTFSSTFEDMKSKQIGDKSVTTRAQIRYIRYSVQLQPDTPLHPVFRDRLLDMAVAHELNETEEARYLAQLLVRDFGTHVITRALAGAALLQVDHVREDWVKSQQEHKSDILAAASASLFSVFHMSASYETKTEDEFMQSYRSQRTSSVVKTLGGPLYRPANFTADTWAQAVDMDLVFLDRAGDPLYYLVTPPVLPELPAVTLNKVRESVEEAVNSYYQFNVWPGCMEQDSPNFSPAANFDDGSCHPPTSNLSFGGVYQTCQGWGSLCSGKTQVNPLTGDYSCPPLYQAVRLYQGAMQGCEGVWFWRRCGDRAWYDMYWCVATDPVPSQSGYLFGGVYTKTVANPITHSLSCPPNFFALKLGGLPDLHVCISDDFEFGDHYAVPFGGFLSCQAGNPLAVKQGPSQVGRKGGASQSRDRSLKAFYKNDPQAWPQRCPAGFSKHLATIEQSCEINYCVKTGAMSGPVLPPVRRPPFMPAPPVLDPPAGSFMHFDPTTRSWSSESTSRSSPYSARANGLSAGAAAGISMGATLVCVVLATVVVLAVRRRLARGRSGYRQLDVQDPLSPQQVGYGTTSSATPAGHQASSLMT